MSLIHILLADGEQATYEEAEVTGLLAQQTLTPEMFYWKEGMTDWRPLAELMPPAESTFVPPRRSPGSIMESETRARSFETDSMSVAASPTQPTTAPKASATGDGETIRKRKRFGRYYFRINPVPLTICLQIILFGAIVATTISMCQCFGLINNSGRPVDADPMSQLLGSSVMPSAKAVGVSDAELKPALYFLFATVGLRVVAEILFLFWIFITNKNCRAFASNIIYTPGWAVAYFFIPIVNLFRPYQVVQEIWKVSENPQGWIGRRDSIFVGLWFLVRLAVIILGKGEFHTSYSDSEDPKVQAVGTLIYIMAVEGNMLLISLTTLILVSVVTWRQVRWERSSREKD